MWDLSEPWWGIAIRVSVIYLFVLGLLRLSGKRQLGQLTPMDLLTILLLSETVSPALTAGDSSLTGGMIASAVLVGLAVIVALATYRSQVFERLVEGVPRVLIVDGTLHRRVMASERITEQELQIALRENGLESVSEVRLAIVEPSGRITCLPVKPD